MGSALSGQRCRVSRRRQRAGLKIFCRLPVGPNFRFLMSPLAGSTALILRILADRVPQSSRSVGPRASPIQQCNRADSKWALVAGGQVRAIVARRRSGCISGPLLKGAFLMKFSSILTACVSGTCAVASLMLAATTATGQVTYSIDFQGPTAAPPIPGPAGPVTDGGHSGAHATGRPATGTHGSHSGGSGRPGNPPRNLGQHRTGCALLWNRYAAAGRFSDRMAILGRRVRDRRTGSGTDSFGDQRRGCRSDGKPPRMCMAKSLPQDPSRHRPDRWEFSILECSTETAGSLLSRHPP